MDLLKSLFGRKTALKRTIFFVTCDSFIFIISIFISFSIKFGLKEGIFALPYRYIAKTIVLFFIIKFFIFFYQKLYQFTWQYVGLNDLYNILKANITSTALIVLCYFVGYNYISIWLPKSVIITDFFISFILTGSLRISKRIFMEIFKPQISRKGKSTLIIGAGDTGEMIVRDFRKTNFENYYPIGFLDNDRKKWGSYIHNAPVLGNIDSLEKHINKFDIDAIIIADQSLNLQQIRNIYLTANKIGVNEIKIVPKLYSQTDIEITTKKLEDIQVEDLINRQEIQIETDRLKRFFQGKRILITGAAGSIGSEIVRQIALFDPLKIILFEIDETEIFYLENLLKEYFPEIQDKIISVIGDICDKQKLDQVFKHYKPEIVFAAAAYKHVPILEDHPDQAIKVNIFGTYNLCETADRYDVERFINISTDKAVKPASVMGFTKRIGEYIARVFNDNSKTQYISVRFGNVLGSRGSVIPIFLKQIQKGGPVTITHPEMKRYFMTIPESVSLVLEAALIGNGGEVMVLDMGEPIYINRLAEELIKLHGLVPGRDIEIIYTGIRPGEKLFEEILTAEEGTSRTMHERIYLAKISNNFSLDQIKSTMNSLHQIMLQNTNSDNLKKALRKILHEFKVFE